MEREKKVIDASVIVKWFCDEKGTKQAIQIKQDHIAGKIQIIVPELLFTEVLNALRYKNASEKSLIEVNNLLWNLGFQVERNKSTVLEKAIKISLELNLTIYDAIYLALAQLHGAPLITADNALSKSPNTIILEKD